MKSIDKFSKIKREALREKHYFQSLLEQASMEQLLSEADLEQIQIDCLAILARKTERYNSGDSSSIPIEKAQNILSSIMFTIGVQLKTFPIPDDAISALQSPGTKAIYTAGYQRIENLISEARIRHGALRKCLLQTPNEFYSDTIVDGIEGFFILYRPEFTAQEIHITADYPVYNKARGLLGIEFIVQYLEQLYYENMFCVHFAGEDIHHLLCGYDEHYQSLLFNLYEPVLAASLGCILTDTDCSRLQLTREEQSLLNRMFEGKTKKQIEEILTPALAKLSSQFSFSEDLQKYVLLSLPLLGTSIERAAKEGTLNKIFIVPEYPEANPRLMVSYGEKMDNKMYRRLLNQFVNCRSTEDKISLMKEQIHSLADLDDLLQDGELDAEEIMVFLKELSLAELGALLKKYSIQYEMNFTELRDSEKKLCEGLHRFAASLSAEQSSSLERILKQLELN